MANDFNGSIAQNYITFATTVTSTTVAGANYQNVMLFVGSGEAASGGYFTASGVQPVGTLLSFNASTYGSAMGGQLLTDMTNFFAGTTLPTVYVSIYDDAATAGGTVFPAATVSGLSTQFNANHTLAYFKHMTMNLGAAHSALATLCSSDTLLSQCWIDTSDANVLSPSDTTSVRYLCAQAGSDPVIVYHATTTIDGALVQLGLTLGFLNTTGTSVGNNMDYLATSQIITSGGSSGPLSATNMTILSNLNVGFYLYLGDTSGRVALRGGKTLKGNLPAAQWLVNYVDYMCQVESAQYLTQFNHFKNNDTYQGILTILRTVLSPFADFGRLSYVKITAPTFANLPPTNGQSITIPNAWQATFNDNVRNVVVNGSLYIALS